MTVTAQERDLMEHALGRDYPASNYYTEALDG